MDRNDLLRELLYLKKARELERHRADLVVDRQRFASDLERHRHNIFVRRYLDRRIADLDYKIWDYNWRVTEQLGGCQTVQNELPLLLVLDSRYVDCAVDDVLMGRADSLASLTELFKRRKQVVQETSAALLDKAYEDGDAINMSRILSE